LICKSPETWIPVAAKNVSLLLVAANRKYEAPSSDKMMGLLLSVMSLKKSCIPGMNVYSCPVYIEGRCRIFLFCLTAGMAMKNVCTAAPRN
jgi:hypothetical protein